MSCVYFDEPIMIWIFLPYLFWKIIWIILQARLSLYPTIDISWIDLPIKFLHCKLGILRQYNGGYSDYEAVVQEECFCGKINKPVVKEEPKPVNKKKRLSERLELQNIDQIARTEAEIKCLV